MTETIPGSEPVIRLTAFLGVIAAMARWEITAPRHRRDIPRMFRWTNNLALVVIDMAILGRTTHSDLETQLDQCIFQASFRT